jgi:hypothetical protein
VDLVFLKNNLARVIGVQAKRSGLSEPYQRSKTDPNKNANRFQCPDVDRLVFACAINKEGTADIAGLNGLSFCEQQLIEPYDSLQHSNLYTRAQHRLEA